MIVKGYSPTHYLDALQGLIDRLPIDHPKFKELENELGRKKAGDFGERVVMETLEHLKLPYDFYVFHNLSLFIESRIQIDILVLTPHYIVIFEVKNISGSIEFTQNPSNLVRTLPSGAVHTFASPDYQLKEYIHQLKMFFLNEGIDLPIYGAIIFPFLTSSIKQTSTITTILSKIEIKPFLRNLNHNAENLPISQLNQLCHFFLKNHQEFNPYPLIHRYNIERNEIINGVACPNCKRIGMVRKAHHWFCNSCYTKSFDAHKQAISDYFNIISPTITNTECREFLRLNNPNQSYRILSSMNLRKIGANRGARYELW